MSRYLAWLGLAVFVSIHVMATPALAIDWTHGTALNAEPRLPAGFAHFPYVNPDAPKTGLVRQGALGSFDSFNDQITRGEAAPGLTLTYETLMIPSLDETDISTAYGLLAEAIKYPDDFSSVSFRLNANAKWHDGTPVTVDDVIWSLNTLKEISPQYGAYFANVVKGEKTGEREVTFSFSEKGNRELPHILGQLPVFAKHWWEGKDAAGKQRNIAEPTLEPPLGSGPYKIGKFEAGRYVEYVLADNRLISDAPKDRAGRRPYRAVVTGQMSGTDYYLTGGITELNTNIRTTQANVSGARDGSNAKIGAASGSTYVMNIAIDLRLIDTQTLDVVDIVSYQKQVVGRQVGVGLYAFFGDNVLGVNVGANIRTLRRTREI